MISWKEVMTMTNLGNKKIISQNIRFYMDLRNTSRNQICDDLNIKYTTFTDWVNGNAYPRIDKIELLANYFGINKSDLIEDLATDKPQGHYIDPEVEELAQELYDRPELKVLFSTTKKVSNEDLQFVQKMVETMAKKKKGDDNTN